MNLDLVTVFVKPVVFHSSLSVAVRSCWEKSLKIADKRVRSTQLKRVYKEDVS